MWNVHQWFVNLSRVSWGKIQTDVFNEWHWWNWFLVKRRICQNAEVWTFYNTWSTYSNVLWVWWVVFTFWCAAGHLSNYPTVLCLRARQRTASRPWCRLLVLMTRRKSHGRTSISSCGTKRRSCSLLNSMSKVRESLVQDVLFPSFMWPCLMNHWVCCLCRDGETGQEATEPRPESVLHLYRKQVRKQKKQ